MVFLSRLDSRVILGCFNSSVRRTDQNTKSKQEHCQQSNTIPRLMWYGRAWWLPAKISPTRLFSRSPGWGRCGTRGASLGTQRSRLPKHDYVVWKFHTSFSDRWMPHKLKCLLSPLSGWGPAVVCGGGLRHWKRFYSRSKQPNGSGETRVTLSKPHAQLLMHIP